ncbi:MAG TPA: indolepyruvate ferredoxin oxidoreductase family protein [Candidimonas sp.]|nr:indolepyruvate ferredoxin oxidoreductase family protein [Candidimonas sp.]
MSAPTIAATYALDDNLSATSGRIFLTGTQALLRLLLSQRRADRLRGLNTSGFVTGYRGSPLAGVDLALWRTQETLVQHQVRFLPAINEDLAATILMGTQQAGVRDDRTVDGVFGMWYGKGPGVDRAGDALHHGNAAGASRNGGVLLIVGDDHTAASSSIAHASETSLSALGIPIVHPSSIEEYEHFGLWGWALSRYSGAWVAFKAVTETVESARSFELQPVPTFAVPENDAFNGRLEYSAREFLTPAIERRMQDRLQAVKAFSRLHPLDRRVDPAPTAKLGIITTGKAYLDTLDALERLRSSNPVVRRLALRHYKIGLSWPIDEEGLRRFADGLDHILVIEEKAAVIEGQIKSLLFNQRVRPAIVGKLDAGGGQLIPSIGQLEPSLVVTALERWFASLGALPAKRAELTQERHVPAPAATALSRRPYFCSGCPHSTSTRVPQGSQALGGVGCHYMATWMDRDTAGLTQMGGEGADWIGMAPFTRMPHIFQNMGEGTYFHSGYLAIRQAVAADANITYKILFNDAVAMTGGQPVDGPISVPRICQQMLGEGVKKVVITTDDPDRYRSIALPGGVSVHDRHELDRLQRELRDVPGVTVLVHDQACAAEKRRRRKKKTLAEPARRLFINKAVCEGCGDCGTKSNCLSVVPVETPFGRKRAIDQSSCNKDYTCVDGFCPSFVSVIGGTLRRTSMTKEAHERVRGMLAEVPPPSFRVPRRCNVLVVGIGGTGIITVGAIVAMAAHLEGRAASVLDITGLAQKGGTVVSHLRLSDGNESTGAVRIDGEHADAAIFCDTVAAVRPDVLGIVRRNHTLATVNTWVAPTAEFMRNPHIDLDPRPMIADIQQAAGSSNTLILDAHSLAEQQFGDGILANMIMLGFSWQQGGIPVGLEAIMQAITLNAVAVEANKKAFGIGRVAAWKPGALQAAGAHATVIKAPESLEKIVDRCRVSLRDWQNEAYARQYVDVVEIVLQAERRVFPHARPELTIKVAQSLHQLMAYKDEYEVARLFTNGEFEKELNETFEGDFSLRFHLAPPWLAKRDPVTSIPRKVTFGPQTMHVFRLLARLKFLRGTWLDMFGYSAERKMERALIKDYRRAVLNMAQGLDASNYADAMTLAQSPAMVRGYGHIKAANAETYRQALDRREARA